MPEAPAAARGFRITGNPTAATKSTASATLVMPAEAAVGTPASRSTSFIATLSRQRYAVRADIPGMPHRSRTCAAGSTCASTTASSRSTHICPWIWRTAHSSAPSSVTEAICR